MQPASALGTGHFRAECLINGDRVAAAEFEIKEPVRQRPSGQPETTDPEEVGRGTCYSDWSFSLTTNRLAVIEGSS